MITVKTKDKLFKAVQKFVSKYIDTKVYTREDWGNKEKEMVFGEVIFIAEGELYHLLNNSKSKKEWDKLHQIAEKHGCYIEQGFHWSWHFCDKENLLK